MTSDSARGHSCSITANVRVTDAAGAGVGGVAIRIGEQTLGMPQTNSFGGVSISFTYPEGGDQTIKLTPSKYGYVFSPGSASFSTRALSGR